MRDSDEIRVETQDGVLRVTIDRPERMNAIGSDLLDVLEAVFTTGAADPAVRVVVLTGAGTKAFCTGADLGKAEDMAGPDAAALMELSNRVIAAIISCPKPWSPRSTVPRRASGCPWHLPPIWPSPAAPPISCCRSPRLA